MDSNKGNNLKIAEKDGFCQVSITGMRALVLCGLLIESPHSLEEIREKFIRYKLITPENSDDILRIDMNTLKAIGCEISRATLATNHKYVMLDHPFAIKLKEKEFNVIRRAYNKIKDNLDVPALLAYDALFKKVSRYITDEQIKEKLCGISLLKAVDKRILRSLCEDCDNNRIITIVYKAPNAKKEYEKSILAQKLVNQNNKLYLYGYDFDLKASVTLHIRRILKIIGRRENDSNIKIKDVHVKFILCEFGPAGLNEYEKIIEKTDKGYLIEANYHNEFTAVQRILSFGSDCTVIEPDDFKEKLIKVLQRMREMYDN